MNTPSPPGVKIDKQTTLRLTSTKSYIDSDVSSLLSEENERKSKGGMLRKLEWRGAPSSSGNKPRISPSTSPLSRRLGAASPGINNIVVQGRGEDVGDGATVVSGKSRGTTFSSRTTKCSNRGAVRGTINSEASVSSLTLNSHVPPLARLRGRTPTISSISEEQEEGTSDRGVLGSSITISKIIDNVNMDTVSSPKCEIKVDNINSPTSVVQDDVFSASQLLSDEQYDAANVHSIKPTLSQRGDTPSKTGRRIFIDKNDSAGSSDGNYRNAMDRMRNAATDKNEAKCIKHDSSLDASSIFADLVQGPSVNNEPAEEQQDEESITQTIRLPGPIDVDTCQRPVTLVERRNLRAMHKLGYYYLRQNNINAAMDVFMEILRGQRERHGKKSIEVAMAMHNLGVVCVEGGRFREGVRLCDGAARLRVEKLGPDHLDVAVSLAQQGVALMEMQQYPVALSSFQEALRIRRIYLDSKHPLVIRLLNNIGCALFEMSELEQAKEAFDEALVMQRELMKDSSLGGSVTFTDGLSDDQGNDLELQHRDSEVDPKEAHNMLLSIALTQCNLGSIHLRWGKYDESTACYEDALLIQESVLGEDHKVVLNTKANMAFVVKTKEENHQALLENHAGTTTFPSILNMDHLSNLILPHYEEGRQIYDKLSNEIAALLDSVLSPSNNENGSMNEDVASTKNNEDYLSSMEAFVCGQSLLCAEEMEDTSQV